MIAKTEGPITPRDFAQVLFRHKRKMQVWICCVMALTLVVVLVLPRKFVSEAKLFLQMGRESVTLDPTATTGTTTHVQQSRENQMSSTRDMLKSRSLLEQVVDTLGPTMILEGRPESDSEWSLLSVLSFSSPKSERESAIQTLGKSVEPTLGRNSSVINLACTSKNPEAAQKILQTFLDAFRKQHLEANHTAGSFEFFEAQSGELKRQVVNTATKLRDAKNESNIVSFPAEQQALQTQVTQIEAAVLAADAALASTMASVASLEKSLRELPKEQTTQRTSGFPNVAGDSMQNEFFRLLITERELESKLEKDHPHLKVAHEQVRKLAEVLAAQADERTQTTSGINSAHQSLDLDLRREKALAESLRVKATTLKHQYASLQQRMHLLNEQEVSIADLERQSAIAAATYRTYVDHLEQARIGKALEESRVSSIHVVQPPSFEEIPVGPRRLLIFAFGMFVALAGSLGLAFTAQHFDKSLKTVDDVESQLGLPVLGSIPHARNHGVLINN